MESRESCKTFPTHTVELFHYLADFFLHTLAGLTLGGKLHEADLCFSFAEIDLPLLFFLIAGNADAVFVIAALQFIKTGGNQMIFEKFL